MANKELKSTQFISGINDIIYIHINTPSAWDSKIEKYVTLTEQNQNDGLNFHTTATLLIHKESPDIQKLNNIINELSQGLKKTWNNPLKLFEDENNEELDKNYYMITFKSKPEFTIRIVDSLKRPVSIEDNENYKARIIGTLNQYSTGTGGITGYLKAIQVFEKSEIQIGKSITDLFEDVEIDESKNDEGLPF